MAKSVNNKKNKALRKKRTNASILNDEGPSIGNVSLKAKDDAAKAYFNKISELATGRKRMAFAHAKFLWIYCRDHQDKNIQKMAKKFLIVFNLSQIRNTRIIRSVNVQLLAKNKVPLPITPEMETLELNAVSLKKKATRNGVDWTGYFDETNDASDIADCSNDWNCDQKTVPGEASDFINIIKDKNDKPYVMMINRAFGPGKNDVAFPGGFTEIGELWEDTAIREGNEETEAVFESSYSVRKILIPPEHSHWHDPRGKFPYGMINSAVIMEYDFSGK